MSAAEPQTVATLGVAIQSHPACKICGSPHRGEIEDLLALRNRKACLPDGTRVTENYIFGIAQERWGFKLNGPNITSHFRKHFKMGDPEALALAERDGKVELQKRVRGGEVDKVAPEEYLETIVGIAHAKAMADPNSVTIDHGLKAVAELTKRKVDESRDRLMHTLGGAVAAAVSKIPDPPAKPIADVEAEAVEAVDAEVVDE